MSDLERANNNIIVESTVNLRTDISSSYILNRIFSFLEQKQKLNIIIYNKQYQKMFGVNIRDYKKASDRYKIGGRNGKGSEYDKYTNKLLFEGEYINGKRNGKRNGKGKEYNYDGKLEFEGEFNNGKRNGEGKEYFDDNKIKFEGEYLKGERWNGIGYNKMVK